MIPKSEPGHSDEIAGSGFSIDGLSKRNLFLIGIGIAVLLGVAGDMLEFVKKQFRAPPPTPVCYRSYYFFTGGGKPLPAAGSDVTDGRDRSYAFSVKDAARICTTASCDSAALANYRDALHGYLSARTGHMSRLDKEYGDPGLARARRLYQTPDDLEIEQGLRERYRAKVFRINEKSANEDALRILIFKGSETLRPCRRSDYRS